MTEYSQEERDSLFIKLYGNWDNPKLHLSPEELAKVDFENKWWDAIDKAKNFAKRDFIIKEEYIRQVVFGVSKTEEGNVLKWDCHKATGAVQRDPKTHVPYVQVMHNKSFAILWLNMLQFVGHIGQTHFEFGRKK